MQRALHNLKGGARLAGAFDGEMLAHVLEEELVRAGAPDDELLQRVRRGAWLLLQVLDADAAAGAVTEFLTGSSAPSPPPPIAAASPTPSTSAPAAGRAPADERAFVRIRAARLDGVLRLAGELPTDVERRRAWADRAAALAMSIAQERRTLPTPARASADGWGRELLALADEARRLSGGRLAEDLGDAQAAAYAAPRGSAQRVAAHR